MPPQAELGAVRGDLVPEEYALGEHLLVWYEVVGEFDAELGGLGNNLLGEVRGCVLSGVSEHGAVFGLVELAKSKKDAGRAGRRRFDEPEPAESAEVGQERFERLLDEFPRGFVGFDVSPARLSPSANGEVFGGDVSQHRRDFVGDGTC